MANNNTEHPRGSHVTVDTDASTRNGHRGVVGKGDRDGVEVHFGDGERNWHPTGELRQA